jgi:hypothetical protein
MPKRKTTDTELPAAETMASAKPRKTAEKPKASATAHKHTRKLAKPLSEEVTPAVSTVKPLQTDIVPAAVHSFTQEDVARLAYSYWEARGYQGGSPEQDWLHAEQQLFVFAQDR